MAKNFSPKRKIKNKYVASQLVVMTVDMSEDNIIDEPYPVWFIYDNINELKRTVISIIMC